MKKAIIAAIIAGTAAAAAVSAVFIVKGNAAADSNRVSELKVGRYYLSGGTDNQYIEVFPDETICMYGYDGERCETSPLFENRNSYVLNDKLPFIGLDDGEHSPVVGYTYSGSNVILFSDYGVEKQYIFREDETETAE